jgi:hypothetical protein
MSSIKNASISIQDYYNENNNQINGWMKNYSGQVKNSLISIIIFIII